MLSGGQPLVYYYLDYWMGVLQHAVRWPTFSLLLLVLLDGSTTARSQVANL